MGKREPKLWTQEDKLNQPSCKVLNQVIPYDSNMPYDMKIVIESVLDRGKYFEIMPDYAKNIITAFGEVEGRTIGLVAN